MLILAVDGLGRPNNTFPKKFYEIGSDYTYTNFTAKGFLSSYDISNKL